MLHKRERRENCANIGLNNDNGKRKKRKRIKHEEIENLYWRYVLKDGRESVDF